MARNAPRLGARRTAGSVTLVSLCLTAALGIAIGSYLTLCNRSAQFSTRGLNREKARELALVGLEEALWALNEDTWTASGPSGNTAWTTSGANRSTTLAYSLDGGVAGQIVLTIANYAATGPTWPTITSAATVTFPSGETIRRTLAATAGNVPLFANAIASAESEVSFAAGGTVDSWNSDPDNNSATPMVAYSFTAGNSANYNAVVAGKGTGTYGVALNQALVRGYVATYGLPISYSVSGSPAGGVVGPATPAGVALDTSRVGRSAFVPAPAFSVTSPSTSHVMFAGASPSLTGLLAVMTSNPTKQLFDLTSDFNGDALTTPNLSVSRPLSIIFRGNFTTSLLGQITITSTGSLQLFIEGDVTIGGLGFVNLTNDPKKLAIFCTAGPTGAGVKYVTSANFCGVIYSVNTPIEVRENATFYGALLSGSAIRFTHNATAPVLHYDSALRQTRFSFIKTPYLLQGMTEQ